MSVKYGISAGTLPDAKSTARWPPDSAAIARLSIAALTRRMLTIGSRVTGRWRLGSIRRRRGSRSRPRARADPRHGARVRARPGRTRRRGARSREPVPVRARRRARRARADGDPGPRGVRRRRWRCPLVRDRDRGADARGFLGGDHRRRAHVARDDADPALRVGAAEARVATRAGRRPQAGRLRPDGARRRLRRRSDPDDRRAARRQLGGQRLEDLHHQRRAPTSRPASRSPPAPARTRSRT